MKYDAEIFDRFFARVRKTRGCWRWLGGFRNGNGYGGISVSGIDVLAHRLSWEIHIGRIPRGLCVLHHCDNPLFVNPSHLYLGTNRDNVKDRVRKGRTCVGSGRPDAKLTERRVRKARRLVQIAKATKHRNRVMFDLAEDYGVSYSTLNAAINRRSWKHVL